MAENTYQKVKNFIEKYQMIKAGDTIIAGVSGGADSVCLLHILWRLRAEVDFLLAVVHVNHGVRPDAPQDAEYVLQLCQRLEVPFHLKQVDMEGYAKSRKLSAEEAGRILRYEAFEEVLAHYRHAGNGEGKAAVAHTCNDRAETMLFHLFRGSGLKGVGSIRPVRRNIIRPLLCLERGEIEAYLEEQSLMYREDSTNAEDTYARNKIRHHILPYAEKEICAGAVGHMGELADILLETEEFIEEQAGQAYRRCILREEQSEEGGSKNDIESETPGCVLDLNAMLREPAILQKRILLMCLEKLTPHRKDITGQHIVNIMELTDKQGSKKLMLPYGLQVYKVYDRLYVGKPDFVQRRLKSGQTAEVSDSGTAREYAVEPPDEIEVAQLGKMIFTLIDSADELYHKELLDKNRQIIRENRYTKWFDYDKITKGLQLRTRRPGDYLTVDDALHKKSVKQYMINEKIPKIQRNSMYMLADGDHILWIPGYRISQYYKVDENTKHILQVHIRGGADGGTD